MISILNPNPRGMIGRRKNPTRLMFTRTRNILLVGKVKKLKLKRIKVVKHTTLSYLRYLLFLSSRLERIKDPVRPEIIKHAPM